MSTGQGVCQRWWQCLATPGASSKQFYVLVGQAHGHLRHWDLDRFCGTDFFLCNGPLPALFLALSSCLG